MIAGRAEAAGLMIVFKRRTLGLPSFVIGGILVPAVVKWAEDGFVGLAFITPIMLDRPKKRAN